MAETVSTDERSVNELTDVLRTRAERIRLQKRSDRHANGVSAETDCLTSYSRGSDAMEDLRGYMQGEAKIVEKINKILNEADDEVKRSIEGQ